jgi:two-component system, OmpR family, phosphate regulon response regulator PhoB
MTESIVVVEGADNFSQLARRCLEEAGYPVRTFSTAAEVENQQLPPSLMLIDADLADCRGEDVCRLIRRKPILAETPLILLIDSGEDRISGLKAGADDCVSKPFSCGELVARVQAILRRSARALPSPVDQPTDIVIDCAAMRLSVRGSEVAITTLEFRLLDYLARHRGHVFTRDVLLDAVWGEMQFVTPRSVDACVRRVRDKIEPDRCRPTYLKTVRGVGYRFDGVADWPNSNESCNCEACVPPIGPSRVSRLRTLKRKATSASHH